MARIKRRPPSARVAAANRARHARMGASRVAAAAPAIADLESLAVRIRALCHQVKTSAQHVHDTLQAYRDALQTAIINHDNDADKPACMALNRHARALKRRIAKVESHETAFRLEIAPMWTVLSANDWLAAENGCSELGKTMMYCRKQVNAMSAFFASVD
jgi:hypothetical protein